MASQHVFHADSISRRLTISLVLMVAIFACGVAAAFYFEANAQAERELLKHADEMIEYLSGVIALPLWNFDAHAVTAIGETLAQNALVKTLVITDHSGNVVYAYQNDRDAIWITRAHHIQHKGEIIGNIQLTFTKQPGHQAQRALLRVLLATTAMILLALGLLSGVLIRVFLRRSLQRLNAIVNAYAAEKYDGVWDMPLPYLEFQPFGDVLRRLGMTISQQMKRLQESEERYCKAQAIGHVGNWEYHLQTNHFWGSDEAKRIYGFDPAQSDFSTDAVENCIPERERVHQALIDLIESEKPYNLEFEVLPKNSSEPKIIASIAELVRDERGDPLKVVGVIQDITERKRAEKALRESEERFRFVLDNSLDAAYRRNLQTDCYDYISPVIDHVLGWSIEDMNRMDTQTVLALIHPDDVAMIAQEIERTNALCQATGRATGMLEYRIRDQDGEYRWVGDTITTLADKEGRPLYRLGIVRDITDRKRAEELIKNQNLLLEQAIQQKQREMEAMFDKLMRQEKLATIGQMVGSIAHELRNPLGAVKQAVYYLKQLAQKQQLTSSHPKVLRHLELMDRELNASERVIADLLDMTRMKPAHCVETDFRPILDDVIAQMHLPEQVRVTITLEPDPCFIYADPLQMRQVLLNVLTNAAQAIEGEGMITISANALTEPREAVIEIHDTGVGVAPEAVQKVFEPLYTTKATGTGLGLSICKQIVEAHQGRISLISQSEQGTTVTIALPDQTD